VSEADQPRYRVVVLDHPFANLDTERRVLARIGAEVVDARATSEAERVAACQRADAVILEKGQVTSTVIAGMERCKIICAYGAGYDQIDLAAATARGILVANTPGYCDEEVADHALMLLYALARRLYPQVRTLAAAADADTPLPWTHAPYVPIRRLRGQTLGIIGFGRIGRTLGRKAQGVGLQVVAADPVLPPGTAPGTDVPVVPLDDLLRQADFVSLHLPLLPSTYHLIGARELALLKPSAYLVNCARGPIVELEPLLAALEAGRLAGAGLDVVELEPPPPAIARRLLACPNVLLTPHAAWYSEEATEDRKVLVAQTVITALQGDRPASAVN
jgi:D-3-phosphoglycerate dehydrogenase